MISTEIYIEDNALDLLEDISTEFTYVIDDISKFGTKDTSFSKTINIAGTSINNKIFGFVFDLGNSNNYDPTAANVNFNFNASKTAKCKIFVNKIQIFKGILRILEITMNNGKIQYQCSVFGELGGFISKLGNARLEDLDFSAYNHAYTYPNITASWEATGSRGTSNSSAYGTGYYYPLIDYGNVGANSKLDFSVMTFRPAFFVKEYIDKIFANAGYTYTCDFFNTSTFNNLIIPHNQKQITTVSNNQLVSSPTITTYTGTATSIAIGFTNTYLGSFTYTGTQYTYTGTSKVVNLNLSMVGNYTAGGTNATLNLKKNGTTIGSYYVGSPNAYGYFNASIALTGITFNTSDTLNLSLDWTIGSSNYSLAIQSGSFYITTTTSQNVPINYSENITMNNVLPKGVFQKDFFLSICKMFNLYVYDDQWDSKKLIIKPFIDFYPRTYTDALNWTNKIDRSQDLNIKPMSNLNARYYQYKFKDDADYYNESYRKKYNENYGDRIYDTQFDFSKDTEKNEVIFSSSVIYQVTGADKKFPAIYKLSNNNTAEESIDSNIRIMQVKKMTSVGTWNIRNQANTASLVALTTYGYAGHLDDPNTPTFDINFGAPKEIQFSSNLTTNNLFNLYYSEYIAEITDKDSKLLTCTALINNVDINQLDFSKLVWIDGILFRLNKVDNYNPIAYNTTKISLLKVIKTKYS